MAERRDGEDRLYLGNLPRDTTREDIEEFFGKDEMESNVIDIKLLGVYGFAGCKNPQVAKELIPRLHGKMLKGQRVSVQMAKGTRAPRGDNFPPAISGKRTSYRMIVSGLPETSWQDLKDFARSAHVEVSFSEVTRPGEGIVEFPTEAALHQAVKALDQQEYRAKGDEFRTKIVQCKIDTNFAPPPPPPRRGRSHSPGPRGHYNGGGYRSPRDRRSPPPHRAHSPRGYGRERSPARYRDYDYREPPVRGHSPPPPPPPRGGRPYRDDGYAPPRDDYRRGYDDDKYARPSYSSRPRSPRVSPPPRDYSDRRYDDRRGRDYDRRH